MWSALTTAEGLSAWFAERATIDLRPGGAASMTFAGGMSVEMRVERVEEPNVFAYTWRLPNMPDDDPRRTYVELSPWLTRPAAPSSRALATGGPATATDLAASLPVTRQAIAKHLALMADSGLVTPEPGERRRVRYRLRSAPVQLAQQYLAALANNWDDRLDALKHHFTASKQPESVRYEYMTQGTQPPRSCSPKASTSASSWPDSATRRSA